MNGKNVPIIRLARHARLTRHVRTTDVEITDDNNKQQKKTIHKPRARKTTPNTNTTQFAILTNDKE